MSSDLVKRLREAEVWEKCIKAREANTPDHMTDLGIEAADRIEALEGENERLRKLLFAAGEQSQREADKKDAAEARAERLRVALEPFAAFADERNTVPPDYQITSGSPIARRQLTMGNCYNARKAIGGDA